MSVLSIDGKSFDGDYVDKTNRIYCQQCFSQHISKKKKITFPELKFKFKSEQLNIPGTWTTFVHVSGILTSDIQPLIYLWTFHGCSRSSAFSWDIYQSISIVFFRHFAHSQDMYYIYFGHFRHLAPQFICAHMADAHVLHLSRIFTQAGCFFLLDISDTPETCIHLAYLFQIFQTFSTLFIFAHSADAPEVLHFSRIFTWAPGLFFSDILDTSGTWHLAYLFRIFQTFSASFICAHSADAPEGP